MDEMILKDYEEARSISPYSPRGSAALLRLCVEKICVVLGESNGSLNSRIGNLVAKNIISEDIQKALDSVRVIGNDMIHPFAIDADLDKKSILASFTIVNTIFSFLIGKKQINAVFSTLSKDKIKKINERDQEKESPPSERENVI